MTKTKMNALGADEQTCKSPHLMYYVTTCRVFWSNKLPRSSMASKVVHGCGPLLKRFSDLIVNFVDILDNPEWKIWRKSRLLESDKSLSQLFSDFLHIPNYRIVVSKHSMIFKLGGSDFFAPNRISWHRWLLVDSPNILISLTSCAHRHDHFFYIKHSFFYLI